jgi:hypothetical protein
VYEFQVKAGGIDHWVRENAQNIARVVGGSALFGACIRGLKVAWELSKGVPIAAQAVDPEATAALGLASCGASMAIVATSVHKPFPWKLSP